METNATSTLSLIDDLLEVARGDCRTDTCFERNSYEAEESRSEFAMPMSDALLV